VYHVKYQSHEQRRTIRPLIHWLIQEISDEKRGTPKMQRGLFKGPPMKKEAPRKRKGAYSKDLQEKKRHPNTKGFIQKTSDEKRGTPQTQKGYLKQLLFKNARR
jgi:hypothetical protein